MMDFISSQSGSIDALVTYVQRELLFQKEQIISTALASLVKDGVLLYEETEPVIVREFDSATGKDILRLRQSVRLTFRGEEVVENYRKKVERLVKVINDLKGALDEKETAS